MRLTQQLFPFPLSNEHQQNPRDYISQLNDDNMEFQEALAAVVRELQICYTLKEEQLQILRNSSKGKHTVGILPTGFGKSDCFGLFTPLIEQVSVG